MGRDVIVGEQYCETVALDYISTRIVEKTIVFT
jgi:hypothetical protein